MTTQRPERRARTVSLIGLISQVLLTVSFALLTVWAGSAALRALTLLTATGSLVWLYLALVYHQRVLVREEEFETEQLRSQRSEEAGAIFDVADEQLMLARRRLAWMYRWVLPGFSIAIVLLLLFASLVACPWSLSDPVGDDAFWPSVQNEALTVWFVGGLAFLSFLLSRYATGMSHEREWRNLHAGAAYLMGVTLAAAAAGIALGLLHFFKTPVPERVLAQALRLMMLVLAAEVLLNLVLDFYRPRSADEEVRPAFDSRLLGLFTEPGGIAKSMADAINYQFGFEVSSTWFYKLLQRSVVPLIGFALLTLIFASSMVFVRADEQMVIERFGRPLRTADGEVRVFDSGLHVKLPWPVDKAWRVATHRIHELRVGQFEIEASEDDQDLLLWTTKHAREPHVKVLVATPQLVQFMPEEAMDDVAQTGPYDIQSADDARTLTEAVPVSQLRVAVTIQYEIRHPYEWLRTYKSPEGQGPKTVLEMLAKREILKAVAHMEAIELLGPDRGGLESQLWEKIQAQADQRQLGIDIIFLGVQGVHPPTETAEAFQDVIGAESVKMATIRAARADRNRRLAEAAGDVGRAIELARAISRLNQLEAMDNPPEAELNETRARLQRLFFGQEEEGLRPVGGKAAEVLAGARAERWRLVNAAQGNALKFVEEIVLKQAAPNLYRMRHYLIALSEATSKVRKYVIALDEGSQRANTFHLNLQDPRNVPLDVVMDEEQE